MASPPVAPPHPDLRIVPTDALQPHEEHDHQRSQPLIERLAAEATVINPPVVAPLNDHSFLVLDGANRFHAFSHLRIPHILVQVTPYESGFVHLDTWNHVVCDGQNEALLKRLEAIPHLTLIDGISVSRIAHMVTREGRHLSLTTDLEDRVARTALLRSVVASYQQHATLQRTTLTSPAEVWPLHPTAIALFAFPTFSPNDIVAAAREKAYLPPGISRHIIQGRALRIHYPLAWLRTAQLSLADKNRQLHEWIEAKLARREIRYYAEAAYLFDE